MTIGATLIITQELHRKAIKTIEELEARNAELEDDCRQLRQTIADQRSWYLKHYGSVLAQLDDLAAEGE